MGLVSSWWRLAQYSISGDWVATSKRLAKGRPTCQRVIRNTDSCFSVWLLFSFIHNIYSLITHKIGIRALDKTLEIHLRVSLCLVGEIEKWEIEKILVSLIYFWLRMKKWMDEKKKKLSLYNWVDIMGVKKAWFGNMWLQIKPFLLYIWLSIAPTYLSFSNVMPLDFLILSSFLFQPHQLLIDKTFIPLLLFSMQLINLACVKYSQG